MNSQYPVQRLSFGNVPVAKAGFRGLGKTPIKNQGSSRLLSGFFPQPLFYPLPEK
jgi:hypothetical protein